MIRSTFIALGILGLACLLVGVQWEASGRRYDRVMVHCHFAPFHCPPCKKQAEVMPRIHMAYPDMWLGTDESGEGIKRLHQYRLPPNPYNGRSVKPEAYPTTVIYSRGDDGRYRERFRMTGWQSDGDREILEALIRRAAD